MFWVIVLLTVLLLISFNALYVAAEFSTVSSRKSRLNQFAEEGNTSASALLDIVEHPKKLDNYIASCQVGITISSLALGFYGQRQVADALAPLFRQHGNIGEVAAVSFSVTFVLILFTFIQVLFGELIPKNVGLQYPERLALSTLAPMKWSLVLFKPLIWVFNGSGEVILRLLGMGDNAGHTHVHAPEEIAILVEESGTGGVIDQTEHRLLQNALRFRDATVRQIMVPRTQMLAAPIDNSVKEMLKILTESSFSRLPLYKNDIDNIVGFVHLKELLCLDFGGDKKKLQNIIHKVVYIPESKSIQSALIMLQGKINQVAIVLDEYGGTQGMVTIEDMLEEIFGELQDEFDPPPPHYQRGSGNRILISGNVPIHELNQVLKAKLESKDSATIGGLIEEMVERVPSVGEEIRVEGIEFRVEEADETKVDVLSIEADDEVLAAFGLDMQP